MAEATSTILGLMSGSSLDGVDLALVEYRVTEGGEIEWEILKTHSASYDQKLRKDLESAATQSNYAINKLDAELGVLFGDICLRQIEEWGIAPDYIASHGHTVLHAPRHGFTQQIGSPAHISAVTGVPVIADFRSTDIAYGGQGAPLAPIVEKYLFSNYGQYLNLGGIANLSAHSNESILAWDVCPCNQLLNHLAAKAGMMYDDEGALARQGKVDEDLLGKLKGVIKLPVKRPYSLDNTFILTSFIPLFNDSTLSLEDQLCTAVEYIAHSISTQAAYAKKKADPDDQLLATGGGAHNVFLTERLQSMLSTHGLELSVPQAELVDFKEAILMTLCGLLRVHNSPNALASVTGAREDTVNGGLYLP